MGLAHALKYNDSYACCCIDRAREMGGAMLPLWPHYFGACTVVALAVDWSSGAALAPSAALLCDLLGHEYLQVALGWVQACMNRWPHFGHTLVAIRRGRGMVGVGAWCPGVGRGREVGWGHSRTAGCMLGAEHTWHTHKPTLPTPAAPRVPIKHNHSCHLMQGKPLCVVLTKADLAPALPHPVVEQMLCLPSLRALHPMRLGVAQVRCASGMCCLCTDDVQIACSTSVTGSPAAHMHCCGRCDPRVHALPVPHTAHMHCWVLCDPCIHAGKRGHWAGSGGAVEMDSSCNGLGAAAASAGTSTSGFWFDGANGGAQGASAAATTTAAAAAAVKRAGMAAA